jgi:putative sterol carrier protein
MVTLTRPGKEQIKDFYTRAVQRSLDAYARLDEKEWDKKASDEGTAKEHLAVIVGVMEQETLPVTRAAVAGEKPAIPGFEDRAQTMAFRRNARNSVRDLPVSELLTRMKAAFDEHLSMLDSLSETDLDKPATSPAWDRPATIRDLFFGAYLFLPGQYQEIRHVNKKKLPHWVEDSTPDQVNYHMGRLFNYMPLIFRSDKAGDMTATYLFTMEGEGGGQWNISIGEGRADSGDGAPAADPDIEIKTKPAHWVDLSTGDLNPMMAVMPGPFQKVSLKGQMPLAMKLSELFTAEE